MKHVGKMKNNSARVVVAYRTLPGDPYSALVVGTQGLMDAYHDSLMSVVQDDMGQSANELATILSARKFPDGSNMLEWLHINGHLKKVPTHLVLMTPNTQQTIQLDELNKLIAEQKGLTLEELAVTEDGKQVKKSKGADSVKTTSASVSGDVEVNDTSDIAEENLSPAQLRSRADALFKQAQTLRKQADAIDPPKPRAKKTPASVEV
jgi:hypothetical protein